MAIAVVGPQQGVFFWAGAPAFGPGIGNNDAPIDFPRFSTPWTALTVTAGTDLLVVGLGMKLTSGQAANNIRMALSAGGPTLEAVRLASQQDGNNITRIEFWYFVSPAAGAYDIWIVPSGDEFIGSFGISGWSGCETDLGNDSNPPSSQNVIVSGASALSGGALDSPGNVLTGATDDTGRVIDQVVSHVGFNPQLQIGSGQNLIFKGIVQGNPTGGKFGASFEQPAVAPSGPVTMSWKKAISIWSSIAFLLPEGSAPTQVSDQFDVGHEALTQLRPQFPVQHEAIQEIFFNPTTQHEAVQQLRPQLDLPHESLQFINAQPDVQHEAGTGIRFTPAVLHEALQQIRLTSLLNYESQLGAAAAVDVNWESLEQILFAPTVHYEALSSNEIVIASFLVNIEALGFILGQSDVHHETLLELRPQFDVVYESLGLLRPQFAVGHESLTQLRLQRAIQHEALQFLLSQSGIPWEALGLARTAPAILIHHEANTGLAPQFTVQHESTVSTEITFTPYRGGGLGIQWERRAELFIRHQFYFVVNMETNDNLRPTFARIFNVTDNIEVPGSRISTIATTPTLVVSTAISHTQMFDGATTGLKRFRLDMGRASGSLATVHTMEWDPRGEL